MQFFFLFTSHSTSSFSKISKVCYASLIYIQCKLFVESFFPPPPTLYTICPGYLTVDNGSTLPQHPMVLKSHCNEAEQKVNVFTVQCTCDLAIELSCGVSPHRLQPTPPWVPASFPSLPLHPASHNLARESQDEIECIPWDVFFVFLDFFHFDVRCILSRLANNAVLLCINEAVQALNTCSRLVWN